MQIETIGCMVFIPCSSRVTIVYDTNNLQEAYKIAPWGVDGKLWTVYTRIDNGYNREFLWRQEVDGPDKKVFDKFEDAVAYVKYCYTCDVESP